MNLVFELDGVICSPAKGIQFGVVDYIENSLPIVNAVSFMQWLKKENHDITIWTQRPNDLAVKLRTEGWLEDHQVPYSRLLFDRPREPVYVNETPCNAQYMDYDDDTRIVSMLFEEWKQWKKEETQKE